MYNDFYGLRENPFDLTPDPQFLFLSEKHSDALKYLVYGIKQRKGFILITGEVGTGKTTLCRYLLNELPADIQTALILNPSLSEKELLGAILSDFGIDTTGVTEKKDLILLLNNFLLNQLRQGKNAVVIIDEAQNLPPKILEQIRIISNLETDKEKLIQIILVGQPELDEKLSAPELRQLGQRISLRFHLQHLNLKETELYIKHRLSIAGSKGDVLFTSGAIRKIYSFTRGYPRLINIVCDQVLMSGCFAMTKKIIPRLVRVAVKNTLKKSSGRPFAWTFAKGALLASLLAGVLIVSVLLVTTRLESNKAPGPAPTAPVLETPGGFSTGPAGDLTGRSASGPPPAHTPPAAGKPQMPAPQKSAAPRPPAAAPAVSAAPDHGKSSLFYSTAQLLYSKLESYDLVCLSSLLKLWNITPGSIEEVRSWADCCDPGLFSFRSIASRYGFYATSLRHDLSTLLEINVPCILLGFKTHEDISQPHSVVLTGADAENITILDPKLGRLTYPFDDFEKKWSGYAVYVWKKPSGLPKYIRSGMAGRTVTVLDKMMRELGYLQNTAVFTIYGDEMQVAVEQFQKKHGIMVDGVVGPVTQFFMQKILNADDFPKLNFAG